MVTSQISNRIAQTYSQPKKHDIQVAFVLLLLIEASVILWNFLDRSIPCWDTALHRITSIAVRQHLAHPHLFSVDWYRSIFAASPLYPPLVFLINGSLKLIVGIRTNTELFVNLVFVAVLFLSVYGIARRTCSYSAAAPIAAVLVFMYPWFYWSSHNALLDFPVNAMVGLALFSFFWWLKEPKLGQSIILGVVFGLTALTKNNAIAFLAGPVILDIVLSIAKQDSRKLLQLLGALLISSLIILPWVIFAGPMVMKSIASVQQQNFGTTDFIANLYQNLDAFIQGDLPLILSKLLYYCFLVACLALFIPGNYKPRKLYLIASIISGLFIASGFRWMHQFRYIVPLAIPVAVLTADMFAQAWLSRRIFLRLALLAVAFIALIQFTYSAFTPYPIQFLSWLNRTMMSMGLQTEQDISDTNEQGMSLHPLPSADWGASWVLSAVGGKNENNGKPPSLLVMPNTESVNCSTYIYLTNLQYGNADCIEFKNCRNYTVAGDDVRFYPDIAKEIDWYVLKTGDQGVRLANASSTANYNEWCQFVRESKHFKLVKSRLLPDKSNLEIYRRVK